MKSGYTIGGVGLSLSILGGILLSSTIIPPVSAALLRLPGRPSWQNHIRRESNHLVSLGSNIDWIKMAMGDDCPATASWDSLQAMAQTAYVVQGRFGNVVKAIRQTSGPEREEILEEFNLPDLNAAVEIQRQLRELAEYLYDTWQLYKDWATWLLDLPGRRTPNADPVRNIGQLSRVIEEGRVVFEGQKLMVEYNSDGRRNFMRKLAEIYNTSIRAAREMNRLMPWAAENLNAPAFVRLLNGRDPDGPIGGADFYEYDYNNDYEGDMEQEDEENGAASPSDVMEEEEVVEENQGNYGGDEENGEASEDEGYDAAGLYGVPEHLEKLSEWFGCWRDMFEILIEMASAVREVPYPPSWLANH